MTDDELQQIKARHAAASPGPWRCEHPVDMTRSYSSGAIPSVVSPTKGHPLAHCYGLNFGDADFVAASWDDVRRLVTEVERLRGRITPMPEPEPDHIPPAPLRGSSLFLVQRDLAERECEALRAEIERLKADRAALLGLWVVEVYGRWRILDDPLPRHIYDTREAAEEAVLAWAHSKKERG